MKDFNLHKFLRDNPLTKRTLKNGKINEAFEGFGGVGGVSVVGDGVRKDVKEAETNKDPWNWNKNVADMRNDEENRPNKWIMDIDRMPTVNGWKASWEYPGIISWSHAEVPDAAVVATPGWDGPGTPVEFQSEAGSSQMLKVLDQDEFTSFKEYVAAIKPYLDMVLKANTEEIDFATADKDHFLPQDMQESDEDSVGENSPSWERMEGLIDTRHLAAFKQSVKGIFQNLYDDGFEAEEIVEFLTSLMYRM